MNPSMNIDYRAVCILKNKEKPIKQEGGKMKKILYLCLIPIGLIILAQCASIQTWPDYERRAGDRLLLLQEKIGDGLKTDALTPNQAQILLKKLEDIRVDYLQLRDKRVYRDEWENLLARIDVFEGEINASLGRSVRIEGMRFEDRFSTCQRRIDDARISRRLSEGEAREFQARLDAIRSDYLRMTERGRFYRDEDRAEISRRLDLIEVDISRYQAGADVIISSPPAITIPAEPDVIVIPRSDIYYIPDIDARIVFYDGNWYRLHDRHWYISASLSGPWVYVETPPGVIVTLPSEYHGRHRIHFRDLKERWREWKREHRWEHED